MKKLFIAFILLTGLNLYSHAQTTPAQTTPPAKAKKPATTATAPKTTTAATAPRQTTTAAPKTATAQDQQKKTEQRICAINQTRMPPKLLRQLLIQKKMALRIKDIRKIRNRKIDEPFECIDRNSSKYKIRKYENQYPY